MTYGELKKLLLKNNCRKCREGANHERWINESNGKRFVIGRHDSQEVRTGTYHAILKEAGLK